MRIPTGLARGTFDSGAPLDARWYSDEECNDAFALDVLAAIRGMLTDSGKVAWRVAPARSIESVLMGSGSAPSVVWHAAAVGMLLELGFSPAADCVQLHLHVIDECLRPEVAIHPGPHQGHTDWLLRTRHVAWVLACLAEIPRVEGDTPRARREPEAARAGIALHLQLLAKAHRYLVGTAHPAREEPETWIARQGRERAWTEYWGSRQENLLNTLYTLLGLCRAQRHGFNDPDAPEGMSLVWQDVQRLILDRLEIDHEDGLVVRLTPDGDWRWQEEWAQGPLPPGIVGLIALVLAECAEMLYERGASPRTHREAVRAHVTAQRLAHHLCNNPDEWWKHADIFLHTGAEKYWSLPTYSLAVRAILESGTGHPFLPVVQHAFGPIEAAKAPMKHDLRGLEVWADPTRPVNHVFSDGDRSRGHVRIQLAPRRARTHNVGGLHAAVLAYCALRRSVSRADPRDVLEPPRRSRGKTPKAWLAPSPFTVLTLRKRGNRWTAVLGFDDDGLYDEPVTFGPAQSSLLRILGAEYGAVLSLDTILATLNEDPTAYPWASRTRKGDSIQDVIDEINRRLGIKLIERRTSTKGYEGRVLTARMINSDST